jgi:8-oxo-dGTP diphosphatase
MARVDRFILLRHARAGRKLANRTKDFERGLDAKGRDVALRLPRAIESCLQPGAILSSPFRRCLQTVQPLADELDLRISEDDRFTPGSSAESVRAAFLDVPANAVVSTHGEVIAHLFDERVKCAKGAFWVVERRDGELFPLHYVEAPVRAQRSKK